MYFICVNANGVLEEKKYRSTTLPRIPVSEKARPSVVRHSNAGAGCPSFTSVALAICSVRFLGCASQGSADTRQAVMMAVNAWMRFSIRRA